MNAGRFISLDTRAVAGAGVTSAQRVHGRSTVSSTVNGRLIVAHAPGGATTITSVNGVAVIAIAGHKVRVEKARIRLDDRAKAIPAKTKRVEIVVEGSKVFITADHQTIFAPGR